ncbi:right-handed parallel beta-helix repeat-containing protein [Pontiella desulfatans]|nr:right-handed parallel beta-helix repeat-containing protein [Pontiella desulfatans]
MMNRRFVVLTAILAFAGGAVWAEGSVPNRIHVAVDGHDGNPGTETQPVATLHKAKELARERQASDQPSPLEVVVGGGVYYLEKPLILSPEDSGSFIYPITYRAADNEEVVLRGGRVVSGWEKWKDGIYKTNLKEQGLGRLRFHQLFYKSATSKKATAKRQVLARHPNRDPKHPRTGGYLYTPEQAKEGCRQLLYTEGDIPWGDWGDVSQAEIVSPYGGWYFAITPVWNVNREENTVGFRPIRKPIEKMNRFFVQNVLDALDAPGEWFLDYKKGDLYFYPPAGQIEAGQVIVPVMDHVIELKGTIPYPHKGLSITYQGQLEDCPRSDVPMAPVSFITLKGFTIECAWQDAIRMTGARHCRVVNCRITNAGNVGVNIGGITSAYEEVGTPRVKEATGYATVGAGAGGQSLWSNDPGKSCQVVGCDIWETGCEGIVLLGSDNLAENNHIHDIGLYAKDCPGINLLGERNVARKNTIHDLPRCAIFFKGMENVMEFNDIHNVVLETKDMGAIRSVHRNRYLGGDIIRFNRIFDVPGYGFMAGQLRPDTFMTYGVYLDDYTSNVKVQGNIIVNAGRSGIMVHGGNNVLFENNIVYNPMGFPSEFSPIAPKSEAAKAKARARGPGEKTIFRNNITRNNIMVSSMKGATIPYRFARPEFWGRRKAYFSNNLFYNLQKPDAPMGVVLADKKALSWEQWLDFGMEDGSVFGDPGFVDINNRRFELKEDSPAWALGFKAIPVDEIGCYPSPERASWPLKPNLKRFREKPVVKTISGDPRPASRVWFNVEFIDVSKTGGIGWSEEKAKE